jgi:tetraacyldisaccharide 4'-kinase
MTAMLKHFAARLFLRIVRLRNALYDRGVFRTHRIPVPVVSVGNLSVGGTGKTPMVEFLCARFLSEGMRVAVVTRGYKRRTRGAFVVSDGSGSVASYEDGGDEAVQLAQGLPSLVVIADEKRVRGCMTAVRDFGVERIVLDDAFQHRACRRDCDVVLLDATQPLHQAVLPAGRYREPLAALRRASIVVATRCQSAQLADKMKSEIAAYFSGPVFASKFMPSELAHAGTEDVFGAAHLRETNIVSFCGIGSPGSFDETLSALGVRVQKRIVFPDHHAYNREDVESLRISASECAASALLTTEKDAVRLGRLLTSFASLPVYYVRMKTDLFGREDEFFSQIRSAIHKPSK